MLLTKHESETFENETVYVRGQAFVKCSFVGCTLVLRETVYHLDGCTFDRCNWHVDCLLLWGSEAGVEPLRELVRLIEQGLVQVKAMQNAEQEASTQNGGSGSGSEGPPPSPFA